MNVKEGMRRLALLVGVIGTALGCFASYTVLHDAMRARARYKTFERLATSDVVQQERKSWGLAKIPVNYDALAKEDCAIDLSAGFNRQDAQKYLAARAKHCDEHQDPFAAIAKPFSEVNRGGIKTITWTKDLRVESIETEDGTTVYPAPAPTLWPYLLAAIFPVLGFFVPWGSVRVLTWVGVGFFEKSD